MKTLRSLSNRKLDKLQDRLGLLYWNTLDVSPRPYNRKLVARVTSMMLAIGKERLRRLNIQADSLGCLIRKLP